MSCTRCAPTNGFRVLTLSEVAERAIGARRHPLLLAQDPLGLKMARALDDLLMIEQAFAPFLLVDENGCVVSDERNKREYLVEYLCEPQRGLPEFSFSNRAVPWDEVRASMQRLLDERTDWLP